MKKGISPLIAAVLLIAFTMSIAMIAGPFFSDFMQQTQQGQSEEADSLLESSKSSLQIEDVAYDTSSGNYTVTIKNNGQTTIENYTAKLIGDEVSQKTFYRSIEPNDIHVFEISTSNSTDENELTVESLNKAVAASTSLDDVVSGSSPAAPSGLNLTS